MFNWFIVNDVKVGSISELPKELLDEIIDFDLSDLEKTDGPHRYYYDLLDEIKSFSITRLKHVQQKDQSTFLVKLQYTLELIALNDRVKIYGKDTGYSYTDQEYKNAFKKFLEIEIDNAHRVTMNISTGLFILSGIGLLLEYRSFLSGIYFTNLLLGGSLILRKFST